MSLAPGVRAAVDPGGRFQVGVAMEETRIEREPRRRAFPNILLFVALALGAPRLLRAQAAEPPAPAQPPNADNAAPPASPETEADEDADRPPNDTRSIFAPPDRTTLRLLTRAEQLLQRERYAEAVRCLGAIFDSPQDYFFYPNDPSAGPRSLKAEAQRLLGQMSRRGRELYELQYGARARRMLDEAAAAGDAAALAEVSRRFFHTRAGYEATFLLGLHHLDHGRALAGVLALERLRDSSPEADQFEPALSVAAAICWIRAGDPEKAARSLALLEERFPQAAVQIAGRDVPLFVGDTDVLEHLTRLIGPEATPAVQLPGPWAMFRGNAARNISVSAHGPLLNRRWRVPSTCEPFVEALIEHLGRVDQHWDRLSLPALHPLAVDDVVLLRTAGNLLAVDFATGKRLWESPVDNPFAPFLNPSPSVIHRRARQLEYAVRLRLWADATYGTMSSDGECVFVVEDLGLEIGPTQFHPVLLAPPRWGPPAGEKTYNRLAAYDVRSGRLKWHVGGSEDEYELPEAGTFFLGPPLPLMGRLYVIGETMGEIRLMALDAKSGELIWWQQLTGTDQLLIKDPLRRMAGVSPSYADGVLVCPTGNKSMVAVRPATRSLLWGYAYPRTGSRAQPQLLFFGARSVLDPDPVGRWVDSAVVLAERRVLATPVDSDALHCLDLFDGRLLWKEPRQDDLYLACVHQGKAILVGGRGVRALDLYKTRDNTLDESRQEQPLEDPFGTAPIGSVRIRPAEQDGAARPALAWDGRTVRFPPGSRPSGMGFLSGNLYYVPLSTAEVMTVDLSAGRPGPVFKSRRGSVPGNLVCFRGRILSQDAAGLEAFDQLEALRSRVDERLASSSNDAEALCLRGEILWDEGGLQEAIECFRRAHGIQPSLDTRQLLREALFDGLRTEFATHRGNVQEIQELIEQPSQRATYLRLMAAGLTDAGEFLPALEHYWKLIDLDCEHRALEPIDASVSVRRDRWIQHRLAALRQSCPEPVRTEIDRVATVRWKAALEEGKPQAVHRFLEYFAGQPIADEARRHLARQYRESGELLAIERLLRHEERSQEVERRGAAVAELAEMLRGEKRWRDAALCYARLGREWAEVACRDGRTGRELVDALSDDDPVRDHLRLESSWPTGEVLVSNKKSTPKTAPRPTYNRAPLAFHGSREPFFSDMTVELHQAPPPRLVARDGLGKEAWELPLTDLAAQGDFLLNRGRMRLSACGHLLLLASGQRVLAVDTLGSADDPSARVLWRQDVQELGVGSDGLGRLPFPVGNLAAGMPEVYLASYAQDPIDLPRIVNEEILCFKRFRSCVAVDPWTGKTLWVRENVARDSELFGDHQYVFLVPAGQTTATVLDALDGQQLGQREVPLEREATLGRRVLAWRHDGEHRLLEMIDPWDGRPVWPAQRFPATATLHHPQQELVAVHEPGGRFVLIDLNDGRRIIDDKLQPRRSLPEMLVFPSPDRYTLVLYDRNFEDSPERRIQPVHGVDSAPIAGGQVYAFDRDGNRLWPAPVTVEQQRLPLNQASRLPVLTFASMIQERRSNSARHESKTSILCIDKRTGREVFREQFRGATNSFRLVGDPEKRTVEIELQQTTVTLTFTDQPPAPKTDQDDAPETQSDATQKWGPGPARALWKAIRAAISGAPSESNDP